MNNTQKRRRAEGMCVRCGEVPPVTSLTSCKPCLAKSEQRRLRYRFDTLSLRCGGCGAVEDYRVDADELVSVVLAKTRCMFCGGQCLAREPRKAG